MIKCCIFPIPAGIGVCCSDIEVNCPLGKPPLRHLENKTASALRAAAVINTWGNSVHYFTIITAGGSSRLFNDSLFKEVRGGGVTGGAGEGRRGSSKHPVIHIKRTLSGMWLN